MGRHRRVRAAMVLLAAMIAATAGTPTWAQAPSQDRASEETPISRLERQLQERKQRLMELRREEVLLEESIKEDEHELIMRRAAETVRCCAPNRMELELRRRQAEIEDARRQEALREEKLRQERIEVESTREQK